MLLSFFCCQFLYAVNIPENQVNMTKARIIEFNLGFDSRTPFDYLCARISDACCGWFQAKKQARPFKDIIIGFLQQAAQDVKGSEGQALKQYSDKLAIWLETADLCQDDFPEDLHLSWLDSIESFQACQIKGQSLRKRLSSVLPLETLRDMSRAAVEQEASTAEEEYDDRRVNAQIEWDLKFSLLALQIERTRLNGGQQDEAYLRYMHHIHQILTKNAQVTATMPGLKDWVKHIQQNCPNITKMPYWSEIETHIRYPYIDETRNCWRAIYDLAVTACIIAVSAYYLYSTYCYYSENVGTTSNNGPGSNETWFTSASQSYSASEALVDKQHASHRVMQTLDATVLTMAQAAILNCSAALVAFQSSSLSCDQQQQWWRKIFPHGIDTKNWVQCIAERGPKKVHGINCQMLSGMPQDLPETDSCISDQPLDNCKMQVIFGPDGYSTITYNPTCEATASQPHTETKSLSEELSATKSSSNNNMPEIARGYEDIYRRFIDGKLIYTNPNNATNRIELLISELATPLNGTFDLLHCGTTGQYLQISTGYRTQVNPANANKCEIWITPRFLIAKNINTTASQFKDIMGEWNGTLAPLGIFWDWGGYDNLGWYDDLTNENINNIMSNNLDRLWLESTKVVNWPAAKNGVCSSKGMGWFIFHF